MRCLSIIFYNFAQKVTIIASIIIIAKMKRILLLAVIAASLASCHHETLEDQAEAMATDYTERYCPTPVIDMQRTDSVAFDRDTRTFNYYYTLTDRADDAEAVNTVRKKIGATLLGELKENTSMKVFKDAGFAFHYVFRSQQSKRVLLDLKLTAKDYKQ